MSLLSDIKKTLEYHAPSFRVLPEAARKDMQRILAELGKYTEPKRAFKKKAPKKNKKK